MERELRVASDVWPDADFEIRAASENGLNFRGYAAVFDSPSEDLGGFRETIAPGAFTNTIARKSPDIKMFQNHNWDIVLASKGGGTLRLTEDERGLFVDADLPDNEWGRPVRDAVARGDISSMSFGFNVTNDEWNDDHDERRVTEVKLWEVSPVTSWPAYAATSASVRHLAELVDEDADKVEAAIREFFSESVPSPDTRRLMRSLLDAREPAPTFDASEQQELLERLFAKKPD